MFTLAHLSDLHLAPLPAPRPLDLLSKRVLGYVSWHRRRRHIHRAEVLDALLGDLAGQNPDHIAVTGDLVNISLPEEFAFAARWLDRLGPADRVTLVPGNHDAYVAVPWASSAALWAAYMRGDGAAPGTPAGPEDFPQLRRRGAVSLIGLSSALPTAPGFATGRLGPRQIAACEATLAEEGRAGAFRVVLLHHPPAAGASIWRKRLVDASDFRDAVARAGAELVLHGHEHQRTLGHIAGPDGPVPVIGIPSASALPGRGPGAEYLLIEIAGGPGAWRPLVRTRRYDAAAETFLEAEAADLVPA